jgi:hypothetical protein
MRRTYLSSLMKSAKKLRLFSLAMPGVSRDSPLALAAAVPGTHPLKNCGHPPTLAGIFLG